jgi:hypothetical protein
VIPGFREFEFDLPDALLASMVVEFDNMEGATLSREHVSKIPEAQGVYQLIVGKEIVYIGKTDSEAGLAKRLSRHALAIQHRSNLKVDDVSFKAVRVFVFTAMDLETQLIRHYKRQSSVSWNNSGFGSNDPGRNRDHTKASPKSFDALYPIDLDEKVSLELSGRTPVKSALQALRRALPYTLRVADAGAHPDFDVAKLTLPKTPISTKKLITAIVAELPSGWQATALAGRIILYKEKEDNYPAGRIIARN